MPVIGTAGHVDHGKSTLIREITGRNPDRWAEERARGLTIDLGFAWVTLPDGTEVSFVDVPGHERFLKNMLAGIEAVDVALFVVAADEGWMPQSEEHLAVLDLLEVQRGVVAVTKADAVDPDLLELAIAEATEQLRGTSLQAASIVAVSAVTGVGLSTLLDELVIQVPPSVPESDRPRLWVDRSFPVAGAGTVVTGTLLDGPLAVDDSVTVLPDAKSARIRGIQSHETSLDRVGPGRRVALNLGGLDHHAVKRGDMVGLEGQWALTTRFAVSLRTARFVDHFDRRGAYQLHLGSSSHRVEIIGLDGEVAVLSVEAPLPLTVGDRFIIRDTGRQVVVAGGRVLDPAPGRTRRTLSRVAGFDPAAAPDAIADALLRMRQHDQMSRLAAHSRGGTPREAIVIGDLAITTEMLEILTTKSLVLVGAEHEAHPLRPGLPLATLAERLGATAAVAERVVGDSGEMQRVGPDVALSGHRPGLTHAQEEAWLEARNQLAQGLTVPLESELGLETDIVGLMLRSGDLVRVATDLVYLPEQIEQIKGTMRAIEGDFTVAEFRDAAGLSRKYAVPLLEWADKEGLTIRRGDIRRIR